jgi:hypothetical protein
MMRELFIQPRATIDVAEICDFLAGYSRKNAVRLIEDFVELCNLLKRDAKSGFRLPVALGVQNHEVWYLRFIALTAI